MRGTTFLILIITVLLCSTLFTCTSDIAGTTDETEIEVIALTGKIINGTSGNAEPNTVVRLFRAYNTTVSLSPVDSTLTDKNGAYTFDSLKANTYTITAEYITLTDTLTGIHQNILVDTSLNIGADTLRAPGAIKGSVSVDGQASKSNIFCFIPGTSYLAITDTGGNFIIYHVPPGTFDFSYWHQKYNDSTISGIVVVSNQVTTVPDMKLYPVNDLQTKTIYGVFNSNYEAIAECEALVSGDGIPSGSPLSFPLDWNPLSHGFSGYIRLPEQGNNWSATIIVYDTVGHKTGFGTVTFTSLSANILVPQFNPKNAVPSCNAGPDLYASKKDTVTLKGSAIDSFGGAITSYWWDCDNDGIVDDSSTSDTTLQWVFSDTGTYPVLFFASDNDNNVGVDTMLVFVPDASPVVTFISPSQDTVFWDTLITVSLYAAAQDTFGGVIARYRWDFDGDGSWDTSYSVNDTLFHTYTLGSYNTICEVTDDDSNKTIDTVSIRIDYITSASAGTGYSFFIKKDRSVWGCGDPDRGKLGNGSSWPQITSPVKIRNNTIAAVAGFRHSGFITSDNTVLMSGYNDDGELGNGNSGYDVYELNPVVILSNGQNVLPGEDFTLFLKNDKTLWVCGRNDLYGQLGIDTISGSTIPVYLMNNVLSCAAGKTHACAVKSDHSYWAWGNNSDGQIGNGKSGNNQIETIPVKIMDNVQTVYAGWNYTMILASDSKLWACGNNTMGQLGNGLSGITEIEPVPIAIISDVKQVSAGRDHTLILKVDNSVWACGNNEYGQFGNGNLTNSSTPVKVLENVKFVSAGASYSIIIKTDGSVWVSGLNNMGQLGDGTMTNKTKWTPIVFK